MPLGKRTSNSLRFIFICWQMLSFHRSLCSVSNIDAVINARAIIWRRSDVQWAMLSINLKSSLSQTRRIRLILVSYLWTAASIFGMGDGVREIFFYDQENTSRNIFVASRRMSPWSSPIVKLVIKRNARGCPMNSSRIQLCENISWPISFSKASSVWAVSVLRLEGLRMNMQSTSNISMLQRCVKHSFRSLFIVKRLSRCLHLSVRSCNVDSNVRSKCRFFSKKAVFRFILEGMRCQEMEQKPPFDAPPW